MKRLFNIEKWSLIPSGKAMLFAGERPRKVVLEVNTTGRTELVLTRNGESTFLCTVDGRDTVEFYVPGSFALASAGADCWVYTADGAGVTFTASDPESFAVVREFRERNWELELIAAKMAENMNRRLEQQASEFARVIERRMGALEPKRQAESASGRDQEEAGGADDASPPPQPAKARKRGSVESDRVPDPVSGS